MCIIENNAVSCCFSARTAILKTQAVNRMGAIGISQLSAIQLVFKRLLYVSFMLRLKLSLKLYSGPKSKARAPEMYKEEYLCTNF